MLKKLALMIPALRNIHQERNRYATAVESLELELKQRDSTNSRLNAEISELRSVKSESRYEEQFALLQDEIRGLHKEIEELLGQTVKFENSIQFTLEDIRRENFTINSPVCCENPGFQLITDSPIALKSDDHLFPRGSRNDNTRYPRFIRAAERVLGQNLKVMDLGCAGGGLVLDFVLSGHDAIGIEGSDYNTIWGRAEWSTIPDRLFTADITRPFRAVFEGHSQKYDLITAWEVLEHIHEDALDVLFDNIRRHLAPKGVFCGSVAMFEDHDPATGAVWHVTVKSREWWIKRIEEAGFEIAEGLFSTVDYPRGSGNPRSWDWDAEKNPELGFHVCFRLKRQ